MRGTQAEVLARDLRRVGVAYQGAEKAEFPNEAKSDFDTETNP